MNCDYFGLIVFLRFVLHHRFFRHHRKNANHHLQSSEHYRRSFVNFRRNFYNFRPSFANYCPNFYSYRYFGFLNYFQNDSCCCGGEELRYDWFVLELLPELLYDPAREPEVLLLYAEVRGAVLVREALPLL